MGAAPGMYRLQKSVLPIILGNTDWDYRKSSGETITTETYQTLGTSLKAIATIPTIDLDMMGVDDPTQDMRFAARKIISSSKLEVPVNESKLADIYTLQGQIIEANKMTHQEAKQRLEEDNTFKNQIDTLARGVFFTNPQQQRARLQNKFNEVVRLKLEKMKQTIVFTQVEDDEQSGKDEEGKKTKEKAFDEYTLAIQPILASLKREGETPTKPMKREAERILRDQLKASITDEEAVQVIGEDLVREIAKLATTRTTRQAIQDCNPRLPWLPNGQREANAISAQEIDSRANEHLTEAIQNELNERLEKQYLAEQVAINDPDGYQPKVVQRPPLVIEGQLATTMREIPIGPVTIRTDIQSSEGPYPFAPEYITTYPENVLQGFASVIAEYNTAFAPLVAANTEWSTDYQYTIGPNGLPLNRWIQVDMASFFQDELAYATNLSVEEAAELVKGRIFEVENNLASYQECLYIFGRNGQPSQFETEFRTSLEEVR
jgi:hypothetical protein